MKYVLDACALIAYYNEEEGVDKVKNALSEAISGDSDILMHRINLFETYYDLLRSFGEDMTSKVMDSFENAPITVIDTITDELMREAARFKIAFKISVADAFALATARMENAVLITADHHEFDLIDKAGELEFCWIR